MDRLCPQGAAQQRAGNVFAAAKEEFDSKGSNWGQAGVRLLTGMGWRDHSQLSLVPHVARETPRYNASLPSCLRLEIPACNLVPIWSLAFSESLVNDWK